MSVRYDTKTGQKVIDLSGPGFLTGLVRVVIVGSALVAFLAWCLSYLDGYSSHDIWTVRSWRENTMTLENEGKTYTAKCVDERGCLYVHSKVGSEMINKGSTTLFGNQTRPAPLRIQLLDDYLFIDAERAEKYQITAVSSR